MKSVPEQTPLKLPTMHKRINLHRSFVVASQGFFFYPVYQAISTVKPIVPFSAFAVCVRASPGIGFPDEIQHILAGLAGCSFFKWFQPFSLALLARRAIASDIKTSCQPFVCRCGVRAGKNVLICLFCPFPFGSVVHRRINEILYCFQVFCERVRLLCGGCAGLCCHLINRINPHIRKVLLWFLRLLCGHGDSPACLSFRCLHQVAKKPSGNGSIACSHSIALCSMCSLILNASMSPFISPHLAGGRLLYCIPI